jgi:prepilin-type N-terminal cleavage/methylation domain-containing protein
MRSERGYSLVEMLVVVGLIGVASAVSIPIFLESNARSSLWTSSERIGSIIRQTRLKAITQNTTYRVVFDCPSAGQLRGLIMTGDAAVDDDDDRCSQTLDGDSEIVDMPLSISYDPETATALQVTGRGVFTALGDSIPLTISVNYGSTVRTLTVSATGQITFSNVQ